MTKDPYQYFRIEARELLDGLSQGVLHLERAGPSREQAVRLLRLAHTLKGAARVVRQNEISDRAHALEDILAPCRDDDAALPREQIQQLLRLVDEIAARLKLLDPAPKVDASAEPRPQADEPLDTVRLPVAELDELFSAASEAGIHLRSLHRQYESLASAVRLARGLTERLAARDSAPGERLGPLAEALHMSLDQLRRAALDHLENAERDLDNLREKISEVRLLPASMLFAPLERCARDAADSLRKPVTFETAGGEHRLDAHVLRALRDALIHLVRNGVAHGIEPAADRRAAGKPDVGRIRLQVDRHGHRAIFRCEDDGGGIDLAAIRRAAVLRGVVSSQDAEKLELDEAVRLIFRGGVSTARTVSTVAGRGIGLDIVRETVARLNGEVSLRSQAGHGTTIEMIVPVSLQSLTVLAVEVNGNTVSIPLHAVQRTLRLTDAAIARSPSGDSIVDGGLILPFLPLARIFRWPLPTRRELRSWSAVVVRTGDGLLALGVDRSIGIAEVVVRPLPRLSPPVRVLAGTSLDGAGNPQPVLDVAALLEAAQASRGQREEERSAGRRPILVVDDSLTTRMLEQSILESAGYAVQLATSGEDALAKAHQDQFAMFIVDVEMPGMDGFEVIERLQQDSALRAIPAMLVTSRNAAEDRHRGEQVGARAYIVKSEFDEAVFLRTIRGLIG